MSCVFNGKVNLIDFLIVFHRLLKVQSSRLQILFDTRLKGIKWTQVNKYLIVQWIIVVKNFVVV